MGTAVTRSPEFAILRPAWRLAPANPRLRRVADATLRRFHDNGSEP